MSDDLDSFTKMQHERDEARVVLRKLVTYAEVFRKQDTRLYDALIEARRVLGDAP